MLSAADKQFYDTDGYLMVEDAISAEQLETLRRLTYDFIEESRGVEVSGAATILEQL